MKYRVTLSNNISREKDIIEGDDLNEVLHTAARKIFYVQHGNSNLTDTLRRKEERIIKVSLAQKHSEALKISRDTYTQLLTKDLGSIIDVFDSLDTKNSFQSIENPPVLEVLQPDFEDVAYEKINPKPVSISVDSELITPIIDRIFKRRAKLKRDAREKEYARVLSIWYSQKEFYESELDFKKSEYKRRVDANERAFNSSFNDWLKRKESCELLLQNEAKKLANTKKSFEKGEKEAVEFYFMKLISLLKYASQTDNRASIAYNPSNKILAVDLFLPSTDDISPVSVVKFIATKDSFEEKIMTSSEYNILYDSILHQITLRLIFDLFLHDTFDHINSICINGFVNPIDKATGQKIETCILSLLVSKSEYSLLDLNNVDPSICFKKLKGISARALATQTAIEPILRIDRTDKRFVEQKDIAKNLTAELNLAAMNWEDFEHLIREIFGLEFSQNGGEVKITQASRDGGVDAIAFDPDPIRGGKIVIQAKRYTNTVGIAAVRDLYGTVLNEGATKGILVTTSDYGADSYEFVKSKPLTLLNGANLLYLLEKHGKKAKIDIQEAKRLQRESQSL